MVRNCSIGAGHLVQMLKQLNRGGGVQSGGRFVQEEEAVHGKELYRHTQHRHRICTLLRPCQLLHPLPVACQTSLMEVEDIQMTEIIWSDKFYEHGNITRMLV